MNKESIQYLFIGLGIIGMGVLWFILSIVFHWWFIFGGLPAALLISLGVWVFFSNLYDLLYRNKQYIKCDEEFNKLIEKTERTKLIFIEKDEVACAKIGELTTAYRWRINNSFFAIHVFEKEKLITIRDKTYKFEDILSCELTDNNTVLTTNTVSKTSTSSMLGRAVIGSALLGGVGAIIGGSTAKTQTQTQSTNNEPKFDTIYTIKITMNDLSEPILTLSFKVGTMVFVDSKGNDIHSHELSRIKMNIVEIQNIASLLSVIVNKNKHVN